MQVSERTVKRVNSAKDRYPDKNTEVIKFSDSKEEAKIYYMPEKRKIEKKLCMVTQLLDLFFAPSEVEGYNCDFCRHVTTCIQQFYIKDVSKFLVVYLKRYDLFSHPVKKISAKIVNELNIDIGSYVISTEGRKNYEYELYAVVEHSGGIRAGHYFAHIKSPNTDKWILVNDSSARTEAFKEVEKCEGFLLFYQLKESQV